MSQPRVFITLGRTGQVVERGGTGSNSRELRSDTGPRSGSKRSTGEALRIYPHGSFVSRKRQREDGTYWSARKNRMSKELGLTANDLRLKLLHRRSKQIHLEERQKIGHLNQNLVKSALPSASNSRFQPRPEKLNSSMIVCEAGARPSDILLKSSRAMAPLTNYDGWQQSSSIRATDSLTDKSFGRNGVFYASMPNGFTPSSFKGTVENAKPVRQLAPMNGTGEENSQGEVHLTVFGLLHSLGLEKYEIAFRAEEVDMTVLKQMGDKDLKDLGIPMGPRKKILLSLLSRSKQQAPQVRNLN